MLTNYKILHEIGEIPHGIRLDSDNSDKMAVIRGAGQRISSG